MKHRVSRLPVLLMTAFFALSIIAGANAASNVPSEMEAWLKSAKLGPYDRAENWDDIVAMAKAEGEVVVYTSSGRIAKLVKRLNAPVSGDQGDRARSRARCPCGSPQSSCDREPGGRSC